MLEKTPESLLDCREIRPVNSKWNQPWIFIGRIDAKVKALVLWLPDAKSWLLEKTLMLGKIEGKKRRRWDEMVGWHHWLNERQWRTGILQCCSPWVCRVGYDLTTEQQQRVMGSNGRHPIKKIINEFQGYIIRIIKLIHPGPKFASKSSQVLWLKMRSTEEDLCL